MNAKKKQLVQELVVAATKALKRGVRMEDLPSDDLDTIRAILNCHREGGMSILEVVIILNECAEAYKN